MSEHVRQFADADSNTMRSLLTILAKHHQEATVLAELARYYSPDPASSAVRFVPGDFLLSVITRTQGTRLDTLRDMLLSLSAQSCQDFESIIVLHKCATPEKVAELVDTFPSSLTRRIRLISCDSGNRGAPLNSGVEHALGNYLAFVDDDDFVFAHWVETFKSMALEQPGKLLRTVCARQDAERGSGSFAESYAIAVSWFSLYPAEYDLFAHLSYNQTPFLSLCFPAFVFRNIGMRFDESLTTTEDWEFGTRVALLCGVYASNETTSIYRWWSNAKSSMTEHSQAEWVANRQHIIDRLNAAPLLLPADSLKRIIQLQEEVRELVLQRDKMANGRLVGRLTRGLGSLGRLPRWWR